ncbi:hypothetical protein KG089_02140 [Carnobacteriaceae bacterium zg-ZUI252]|nr:hypothetical protein [Carnobacteriaceae bacterium zg-ZUI252]MBS4770862.1 hypothetical protein [Carnobacteriaceae bacterium zg-ZUI240]
MGFILEPNQLIEYFNKEKNGEFAFFVCESLPYILSLAKEHGSVKEKLIKGLNLGGDTDSILAISGFIYGIKDDNMKGLSDFLETFLIVNKDVFIRMTECYDKLFCS